MRFELPELPYQVDALEPLISKYTLELHHERHHQAYLTSLNSLIAGTKFENKNLETLIKITEGPIFNNASQAWNHTFYFEGLGPGSSNTLKGPFEYLINWDLIKKRYNDAI
jgi:Fe-Mn family superoxide dismutase